MEQVVAIIMVSVPCAAIGGFIGILAIKMLLSSFSKNKA
jgi:uncharacterized membrane protein YheB (UPF0754 family)